VFTAEHYFIPKSFPAVYEASSNVYPDKEAPHKTTIYQMVKKFWDTGSVCLSQGTKQLQLQLCQFQAVRQKQQNTAARIQFFHGFCCFVREGDQLQLCFKWNTLNYQKKVP
jgi:hypothetical protein